MVLRLAEPFLLLIREALRLLLGCLRPLVDDSDRLDDSDRPEGDDLDLSTGSFNPLVDFLSSVLCSVLLVVLFSALFSTLGSARGFSALERSGG